jgi:hypothetical protein
LAVFILLSLSAGCRAEATDKITWWGIYDEPNINNQPHLTPQHYVTVYNGLVPQMPTIDPLLKFAAVELADLSRSAELDSAVRERRGGPGGRAGHLTTPISQPLRRS